MGEKDKHYRASGIGTLSCKLGVSVASAASLSFHIESFQ